MHMSLEGLLSQTSGTLPGPLLTLRQHWVSPISCVLTWIDGMAICFSQRTDELLADRSCQVSACFCRRHLRCISHLFLTLRGTSACRDRPRACKCGKIPGSSQGASRAPQCQCSFSSCASIGKVYASISHLPCSQSQDQPK